MRPHIRTILGTAILLLLPVAAAAQAIFSVDPLLVRLNADTNNDVISITNPTARDIRFEIKAYAWDQTAPAGVMQLTPSTDIVLFPPLVTVKGRTTQRVRVGTTLAPGPIEKSYRIMIEELPDATAPASTGNQVTVRTRIGIPVFIEAVKPVLSGRIDSVSVANHVVNIALANTGTTHAMVDSIVIRGMSAPDAIVFEDSLQGWYVLAGKTRAWQYTFKPAQCRSTKFVEIEVYAHDKVLKSLADVPAGGCTP